MREGRKELSSARRKFRQAMRRVAYWSGRPSFQGFGFSPSTRHDANIMYETALVDAESWADEIARLGGERPKVRDLKAECAAAWNAAMARK